jgi:hypothetical protein
MAIPRRVRIGDEIIAQRHCAWWNGDFRAVSRGISLLTGPETFRRVVGLFRTGIADLLAVLSVAIT